MFVKPLRAKMINDNRYRGSREYWELHEATARGNAWQGRFIEVEELKALPLHAQTAFAARCAMRARALLCNLWQASLDEERCVDELIDFVVRFSCGECGCSMAKAFSEADKRYRACGKISEQAAVGDIVVRECLEAIYDAARVAARVAGHLAPLPNQYDPWSAVHSCHSHVATAAFAQAGNRLSQVHRGMETDFEVLKFNSEREKWAYDSTVEREFFAWYAEFDILRRFDFGNIREMVQGWNAAFNDGFVHFPREFFEMSDEERRSFFATILLPFGFFTDFMLPSENGRAYLIGLGHRDHGIKELLLLSRHAPGGNEALVAVNRLHGREPGVSGVLRFTTAFLMTPPRDYALRVAPARLSKFLLRQTNLHSWRTWLSKHQESELRRSDLI